MRDKHGPPTTATMQPSSTVSEHQMCLSIAPNAPTKGCTARKRSLTRPTSPLKAIRSRRYHAAVASATPTSAATTHGCQLLCAAPSGLEAMLTPRPSVISKRKQACPTTMVSEVVISAVAGMTKSSATYAGEAQPVHRVSHGVPRHSPAAAPA